MSLDFKAFQERCPNLLSSIDPTVTGITQAVRMPTDAIRAYLIWTGLDRSDNEPRGLPIAPGVLILFEQGPDIRSLQAIFQLSVAC